MGNSQGMRGLGMALCLCLAAGCAAPAPPASPPALAPTPSAAVAQLAPEDPLAQARSLFEARQYADSAALARQLEGREAQELTASALLACGREYQAMQVYENLARRYPEQRRYAQVYRALHNGWVVKRADNYLARAVQAWNQGEKVESSRLVEAALDALYSQQGTPPDPQRLKVARQLLTLLDPTPPSRPAPSPVKLRVPERPTPAARPAYPQAPPRVYRPSPRRRQPEIEVARPIPPAPRRAPNGSAPYVARSTPSRVASLRAGESLLRVRRSTMQPYTGSGGSGISVFDRY